MVIIKNITKIQRGLKLIARNFSNEPEKLDSQREKKRKRALKKL